MKRIALLVTLITILFAIEASAIEIIIQSDPKPLIETTPFFPTKPNFFTDSLLISMHSTEALNSPVELSTIKIIGAISYYGYSFGNDTIKFSIPIAPGEIGQVLVKYERTIESLIPEITISPSNAAFAVTRGRTWTVDLPLIQGAFCRIKSSGTLWIPFQDNCKIRRISNNEVIVSYARAGDINLDGIVNIVDLLIISKKIGGAINFDNIEDMDGDGTISREDLTQIANIFGRKYSFSAAPPAPNNTSTWGNLKK